MVRRGVGGLKTLDYSHVEELHNEVSIFNQYN